MALIWASFHLSGSSPVSSVLLKLYLGAFLTLGVGFSESMGAIHPVHMTCLSSVDSVVFLYFVFVDADFVHFVLYMLVLNIRKWALGFFSEYTAEIGLQCACFLLV